MRFDKLLVAGLAALALALGACSSDDEAPDADSSASESAAGEAPSEGNEAPADESVPPAPEPDLDAIPDVVAEVNGEEIAKDEFVANYERQFQQAAAQSQMSGQEPDEDALKKQVADQMVDQELLDQEAQSRDIAISDQQVDEELAELAESNQMGSVDELLAALEEQGMAEDDVRSQVATQARLEGLLVDEAGDPAPTKKELREAYDAAVAQYEQSGQEAPPLKDVRPQLKEQVRGEKLNGAAQTLLKTLREDGDITIHL